MRQEIEEVKKAADMLQEKIETRNLTVSDYLGIAYCISGVVTAVVKQLLDAAGYVKKEGTDGH